jgi:hypothetical protein
MEMLVYCRSKNEDTTTRRYDRHRVHRLVECGMNELSACEKKNVDFDVRTVSGFTQTLTD